MPQQTNLNVSPYFDDFSADKDYHKVLFKPAYPVQARELTSLQSILQNQIERFGQHFFKEGAKVIPGNTSYTRLYNCVELQNTYLGVPVAAYAEQLLGAKITGQSSGISGSVEYVLLPEDSERGNLTLYISYINTSTTDNTSTTFFDGELLTSNITINSTLLGNSSVAPGEPFASTISENCTSIGSAFTVSEGVYFIRGYFVNVNTETLILDQYTNNPSYRIGLFVEERVINSDVDESLNDNSQGFNNYSAPGADRLRISTFLYKKSLTDFDDNNFVELATVENGILKTNISTNTEYNIIKDEFARRTYDESGDYVISNFNLSLSESLNDREGNNGIYNETQFTSSGQTPKEETFVYRLSPGKAFVRGYEVETISTTFLDAPKPRAKKTLENISVNYNTGTTLSVNRSNGYPPIGFGNTFVLSLRDSRIGISTFSPAGKEIGVARVYDYKLKSTSYNQSFKDANVFGISLYDVQPFTEITLNAPTSLSIPTHIRGSKSGAVGFLRYPVIAGTALTVYDTSGTFIKNESYIINGIESGSTGIAVTNYKLDDVKSIFGQISIGSTFSADTVQTRKGKLSLNTFSGSTGVSTANAGITTLSFSLFDFKTRFNRLQPKINDLIAFVDEDSNEEFPSKFLRIININEANITVTGVTTVPGVCDGSLPKTSGGFPPPYDYYILASSLEKSSDNSLYTRLPKQNISDVDISKTQLNIRKTFSVNVSGGKFSAPISSDSNEFFLPYTPDRYSLIKNDGKVLSLSFDRVQILDGGKQLTINNLDSGTYTATLIATVNKINPTSKIKRKNRVNVLEIISSKYEGSGIGETTLNNGLVYGNYPYSTRVEDEIISLNYPDVIEIHGIFESNNAGSASAPKAVLTSFVGGQFSNTSDLVIGERILGSNNGAVAIVTEILTNSQISFIYKNDNTFAEGEILNFSESGTTAQVLSLENNSFNLSKNYTLNNGQDETIYNIGFITRNPNISEPKKRLKIYFSNGYYESNDTGNVTTCNSYLEFDYKKEIRSVSNNGVTSRLSDIIDIRPTVSPYQTSEGLRSPLEFYGRNFNNPSNNSISTLDSNSSILTTFSFYLGRIDRIYLSKDGKFHISYGSPAENPSVPLTVDDAIEIAQVNLPPYLYNISDAHQRSFEYKRYRMSDIKKLEDRIKNLEYYTTLSLLETSTANLLVEDSNGLNRFKSGFFVDNFTGVKPQQSGKILNSIDPIKQQLRPSHYTTQRPLAFYRNFGSNPSSGIFSPSGTNIRLNGTAITLDYTEVLWLEQKFATRSESVTPFLVSFWQGTLDLIPSSDNWVDTTKLEAKVFETEGNYEKVMADSITNQIIDPETGFGPTIWESWKTNWIGREIKTETVQRTETTGASEWTGGWAGAIPTYGTQTTTTLEETYNIETIKGTQTRSGSQTVITEQFDKVSTGDRVLSTSLVANMRSRNIHFKSQKIKPLTQIYAFFDGVNVTKYCVPKLLQIEMSTNSGPFSVGETIVGRKPSSLITSSNDLSTSSITFKLAQPNHKEGSIDSPSKTYTKNPYNGSDMPSTYTSASTIINVDTLSLADMTEGLFGGWVESGMILKGQTSGAEATITSVRLVSDISADLYGSFWIPFPNSQVHPKFETGTKVLTLTNDPNNNQDSAVTIAEDSFTASGTLQTVQEQIISIRNAKIENKQVFEEKSFERSGSASLVSSKVISQTDRTVITGWYDPLAQSFYVDSPQGVFLTRCDVYFKTKDDGDTPVTFQLRTMQNGYPTNQVIPYSEVILNPSQINVSSDGTVATSFVFPTPVYLDGGGSVDKSGIPTGKEYAICLASMSTKYSVFISRVGEVDLLTDTYISNQPYLGSLFKSQNASTWEASQWEDLKFVLYRADFVSNGTLELHTPPPLKWNDGYASLLPSAISFESKKIRVSLASTINDSVLIPGNTIIQANTSGTGNYVGSGGSAFGSLGVSNAGIGYTPSSGISTFNNIDLITFSGRGTGATANITIIDGKISSAVINGGGFGYRVGDSVGVSTIGDFITGRDGILSISSISNINQIIIDDVQGEFEIGIGKTIRYINSLGITTDLNSSLGGSVLIQNIIEETDGLHMKISQYNHGMHSTNDIARIHRLYPDVPPTKLVSSYQSSDLGPLSLTDASQFTTFEGVGVGTTNPGYILINSEIIRYTGISGNNLIGITRGIGNFSDPYGNLLSSNHTASSLVWKYEVNGVSLNRINKSHDLRDVTVKNPVDLDFYYVKIDSSDASPNTTNRSIANFGYGKLFFRETKNSYNSFGLNFGAYGSKNFQYSIASPNIHNVTVRGTNISAEMATFTGKSINGDEIPYLDNGYEPVQLNTSNYFSSMRLVGSWDNSKNLPRLGRMINMKLNLSTTDSYLSPIIQTDRMNVILTSNRINDMIDNYATDRRVNTLLDDPSAFQYCSKEIVLENPASSIQIILLAYLTPSCDLRALYSTGQIQGFSPIYTPFPGYDNIKEDGTIDFENSNGKSNSPIIPSEKITIDPDMSQFKEYTFSVDNLQSFRNFRIKLIGTSTNQTEVPIIRDLRVIALA